MLGVATSLENSKTVFSLSVLCLVTLPRREKRPQKALSSCGTAASSRWS